MGEYAVSSQKVRNGVSLGTIRNQGWQVTASYVLTRRGCDVSSG